MMDIILIKKVRTIIGRCVLLLVCAICLFWPAGCGENEDQKQKPGKEPVKIGVIYPFTGPNAATGEDLKSAVELAKEIINGSFDLPLPMAPQKGLVGLGGAPVEIVYRDSQSDPDHAAAEVETLRLKDRVSAVMGCYGSTITASASEKAEMLKLPFLNAASTSPILTQRGLRWFFRTTPDDAIFVDNFFSFLSEVSKKQPEWDPRRLILVYENRLFGTGVASAERKLAKRLGYPIAGEIPYDSKASEFEAELEEIGSLPESVILQTSYANDAVAFMKGYKARGVAPVAILGMDAGFISPDFIGELGPDAEHVLSREVWAQDLGSKKPVSAEINRLFHDRYGRNMTGNSARAFTGLLVLADAINRAGSTEPESIREALLATHIEAEACVMPWDGIRFDPETGQNILGKGIIVQIQNGGYRTVWPENFSETDLVWPMPASKNR